MTEAAILKPLSIFKRFCTKFDIETELGSQNNFYRQNSYLTKSKMEAEAI